MDLKKASNFDYPTEFFGNFHLKVKNSGRQFWLKNVQSTYEKISWAVSESAEGLAKAKIGPG